MLPDGHVDERSIVDVKPEELVDFTQWHLFAGIGVWAYALREAGWPDDREVMTGSAPCQPFSTAGQGKGVDDERHLWPAFYDIIKCIRPSVIFGEQLSSHDVIGRVNGKNGRSAKKSDGPAWLDVVSSDLEDAHYAIGPISTNACSTGAPHLRQRVYWVAQRTDEYGVLVQLEHAHGGGSNEGKTLPRSGSTGTGVRSSPDLVAPAHRVSNDGSGSIGPGRWGEHPDGSAVIQLGNPVLPRLEGHVVGWNGGSAGPAWQGGLGHERRGPVNGFWASADWIFCRDGYWRPVEQCLEPLVTGLTVDMGSLCPCGPNPYRTEAPSRAEMLKGYGNAIVAPLAIEFVKAYMAVIDEYKPDDVWRE